MAAVSISVTALGPDANVPVLMDTCWETTAESVSLKVSKKANAVVVVVGYQ